jgi:hypothetical protein
MDESFHCPKCRTDLRHSLALHGAKLSRCPYCAHSFPRPESEPPTQASITPAIVTDARSDQNVTNAPRAGRPIDPITHAPLRGKRPYPDDDDYLPARKRILSKMDRWSSGDVGALVGMATGLAIGIFVGGICTATADKTKALEQGLAIIGSVILGVVLIFVGAIVGGVVGYYRAVEPPNKDEPRNTPQV